MTQPPYQQPPQIIIVQQPQKSSGCLSCIGGIVVAIFLFVVGMIVLGMVMR